jgi:hypothetical protein
MKRFMHQHSHKGPASAGWQLPYKKQTFNTELSIFCLFSVLNFPRLLLGSSGNKAEKLAHIIGMMVLSGVAIVFHTYFITLQVFVCAHILSQLIGMLMHDHWQMCVRYACRLRIDQILGGTALAIVATQVILAVPPAIRILKSL